MLCGYRLGYCSKHDPKENLLLCPSVARWEWTAGIGFVGRKATRLHILKGFGIQSMSNAGLSRLRNTGEPHIAFPYRVYRRSLSSILPILTSDQMEKRRKRRRPSWYIYVSQNNRTLDQTTTTNKSSITLTLTSCSWTRQGMPLSLRRANTR